MELLSPGGSPEGVVAAVQNGANAVYLGYGDFNARRNAKNFTQEQAEETVTYCHLRGVSVFLTLNTLLTQRELESATALIAHARDIGIDAVIVQDLGVASAIQQIAPDLSLHASTQLTVHSLDGVKQAADLGFSRVVLSRELSRDQMEYIAARSPLELEAFVHGAMCMSYSGQCYFSAMIGQRSGNRGLCAQPCRLDYQWQSAQGGKPSGCGTPMSLKDMSLAGHLQALQEMGMSCLKIEGRMKRPEYVAIVTGIYAAALREGREPTQEELRQLEAAFSRQGFTQGYFLEEQDNTMFGTRQQQPEPKELFAAARATYQKGENVSIPLTGSFFLQGDSQSVLTLWDQEDRCVSVSGQTPEPAKTRPLTQEGVTAQLSRTGGTPFVLTSLEVSLEPGLSLPVSGLNALRREGLDQMAQLRMAGSTPQKGTFVPIPRGNQPQTPLVYNLQVDHPHQLTPELLALPWGRIHLPQKFAQHPEVIQACIAQGHQVSVVLPRILWDREQEQLGQDCQVFQQLGVNHATVGTLDGLHWGKSKGFTLVGDFGLGVYNNHTLHQLKTMGLTSAVPSFELKFPQIRDLNKSLPLELLAYGHLPLMLTEHSMLTNHFGTKQEEATLIDRKGIRFPVVEIPGGRNEIRNSTPLFLADKTKDWSQLGLGGARLLFTQESPTDCVKIATSYLMGEEFVPEQFTRGLYYRGVE